MRLFYLIWVDCIVRLRSQPANKNTWKYLSMTFMTIAMAVDFLFLTIVVEKYILGYRIYNLQIPGIPPEIGDPISFIILFLVPPSAINYLLIFRNHRYEKLIKKYEYHEGKLMITFVFIALFVPIICIWARYIWLIFEKS
jgi:hypothetical protein